MINDRLATGLLAAVFFLSPISTRAEDPFAENMALLAISVQKDQVSAGMMSVSAEFDAAADWRSPPKCERFVPRASNMSRRAVASILNPDVLAFDVTSWPRRAIAQLAGRVQSTADPLKHEFTGMRLAGHDIRRIEETGDEEENLSAPIFELSSGCYLLMIVPGAGDSPKS